jgi:hypothetical protein
MRQWTSGVVAGVACGSLAGFGCEVAVERPRGGDAATQEQVADSEAEVDVSNDDPGEDAVGEGPEVAPEPEPEGPPPVPYPEGPYGINALDIIANESFYDPAEDQVVRLSDFYLNPDVVGLVIVSSAGWCSACSYEAWDLVEVQERYRDDGLRVLYTLYEDAQGRPLWADPDNALVRARDTSFVASYRESLGRLVNLPAREANYPVLIDVGHTLGRYFDQNATPLTIIVRTMDMRIEYRTVGYSPGTILAVVRSAIF